MGLVTCLHGHTLSTHSQCVADPCCTPQGRAVGRGRAPNPGRPTPRQEAPPWGALVPPPQRAKPARKTTCCGVDDGSPRPHPTHPQPVGSRPLPHAPRTGRRVWESAHPRTPHTQARGVPPRALSCRCHSAQSLLARVRAVGLMTGPQAHTDHTYSQWVAGPVCTSQVRAAGRGECPTPDAPHPGKGRSSLGGLLLPPQRSKLAPKIACRGVGDGSPR